MYLRKLKIKDANLMLNWMHDDNVVKKMGIDFKKFTLHDCEKFIKQANKSEFPNLHRAICSDKDEYLGTISLKNISKMNKNAEYAIVLNSKAMGKGIASEATTKILSYAFYELELHKVYLYVKLSNKRAIKFYKKYGFKEEGRFIDHIMENDGNFETLMWMAFLSEDFTLEVK